MASLFTEIGGQSDLSVAVMTMKRFWYFLSVFAVCPNAAYALEPFDTIQPILTSEVKAIGEHTENDLPYFRCVDPETERVLQSFAAKGVIFGHFLSPASEDAIVSAWAGEMHPDYWGGTLLLTKQQGEWVSVWYKSGVISRHCIKLALKSGREILLCEAEEGGMGHTEHLLYSLDALAPANPYQSCLVLADSFDELCQTVQRQIIERIEMRPPSDRNPADLTVIARHGRNRLSPKSRAACLDGKPYPEPATQSYQLDFVLREDGFHAAPGSETNLKLFSRPKS